MRGSLNVLEFCAVIELQCFTYFKRCFSVSEFMHLAADRPAGRAFRPGCGRSASPGVSACISGARLRESTAGNTPLSKGKEKE